MQRSAVNRTKLGIFTVKYSVFCISLLFPMPPIAKCFVKFDLNNIVCKTQVCRSDKKTMPQTPVNHAITFDFRHGYVFATGIGQSSSVMLDQKIQIVTTERRVKSVSKSAPLILPLVPLQMCTLTT
jgi:hypothetical protein